MIDSAVGGWKRWAVAVGVVAALATAGAGTASAQPYGGGGGGPVASPYLNLLRGSNPAYLNYYGLVRPDQQARAVGNQVQQQQQQLGAFSSSVVSLQQAARGGADLQTGHGFGFQTQRSYFMTTGVGGNRGGLQGGGQGGGGQGGGGQGFGTAGAGGRGGAPSLGGAATTGGRR